SCPASKSRNRNGQPAGLLRAAKIARRTLTDSHAEESFVKSALLRRSEALLIVTTLRPAMAKYQY
ncbi:MAG: hypothetical protein LCH99_23475, partial [Proteobacteria bacterium]|nr:hypothetical protein [Pseudomonadota bacterium]